MKTIQPYMTDVIEVVKLGNHYQLKFLKSLKMGGFGDYSINFGLGDDIVPARPLISKNTNDKKLQNNISRAISTARDIALSNDWDWFVTLTLDPKKYDRFDLEKFHKDLTAFIKSVNRRFQCHIQFLLVPERHKNGAWHMHGLLADLPGSCISINDFGFFDWDEYSSLFGYVSLSSVENQVAVSLYITKHLGKQIYNGAFDLGSHLYYCSRGLNRSHVLKYIKASDLPPEFKFQYESEDGFYKSSFFADSSFLEYIGVI